MLTSCVHPSARIIGKGHGGILCVRRTFIVGSVPTADGLHTVLYNTLQWHSRLCSRLCSSRVCYISTCQIFVWPQQKHPDSKNGYSLQPYAIVLRSGSPAKSLLCEIPSWCMYAHDCSRGFLQAPMSVLGST